MDDDDAMLDCVQITPEHIRANGTLHTTTFAGIGELVDNSVDSKAKNVWIDNCTIRRTLPDGSVITIRYIVVKDDGSGMDREEALKTILVGFSMKRGDCQSIGQFGNGLKSGSMRVGSTMLMATRKKREFTLLMISLKYLDTVKNNKCYVPVISYTLGGDNKLHPIHDLEYPDKHEKALALILKYSPFATEELLHDNFLLTALSNGETGTAIAVSDLKRLENDDFELVVEKNDLAVENREAEGDERQYHYLSHWLQTLYFDPRIVIFIHNHQVRLLDVRRSLASPRWSLLAPKGMELFAKREKEDKEKQIKRLNEAKLPLQQQEQRLKDKVMSVDIRQSEMQRVRRDLERKRDELKSYDDQILRITNQKASGGADIKLYFGIDVINRNKPRIIFYSNGRRILTQPMDTKKKQLFHQAMGVVCVVDIPATLLHTKQTREHFEIPSEFDFVVKKIKTAAITYFTYIDKKFKTPEFWHDLSYDNSDGEDIPDLRKPGIQEKLFNLIKQGGRQCAICGCFRQVPYSDGALPTQHRALEKPMFKCPQDKNVRFDHKCLPITAAEVKSQEIKKLEMKEKSYYDGNAPEPKKSAAKPLEKSERYRSPSPAFTATGRPIRKANELRSYKEEPARQVRSKSRSHAHRNQTRSRSRSGVDEPRSLMDPPIRRRKRTPVFETSSEEESEDEYVAKAKNNKNEKNNHNNNKKKSAEKKKSTPALRSPTPQLEESSDESISSEVARNTDFVIPKRLQKHAMSMGSAAGSQSSTLGHGIPKQEGDAGEVPLFRAKTKQEIVDDAEQAAEHLEATVAAERAERRARSMSTGGSMVGEAPWSAEFADFREHRGGADAAAAAVDRRSSLEATKRKRDDSMTISAQHGANKKARGEHTTLIGVPKEEEEQGRKKKGRELPMGAGTGAMMDDSIRALYLDNPDYPDDAQLDEDLGDAMSGVSIGSTQRRGDGPAESMMTADRARAELDKLPKEEIIARLLHMQDRFHEEREGREHAQLLLESTLEEVTRLTAENGQLKAGQAAGGGGGDGEQLQAQQLQMLREHNQVMQEEAQAVNDALVELAAIPKDEVIVREVRRFGGVNDATLELTERMKEMKKEAEKERIKRDKEREMARQSGEGGGNHQQ